jgi:hypothetical protein
VPITAATRHGLPRTASTLITNSRAQRSIAAGRMDRAAQMGDPPVQARIDPVTTGHICAERRNAA